MDISQEKYVVASGPEYPHNTEPQYQYHPQQPMQGQPPVQSPPIQEHYKSPESQPQQQQAYPPQQQHPYPHQHQPLDRSAFGQQGGKWQASLCDCSPCTSCLLSWCFPCLLLGQTSERIRDPSMQTADMMNSDCMIHGLINCFTGCGWIYAMLKRSEIRERYQIEGSGFDDCCVSYWCPCCALTQQDNEVVIRQRNAAPPAPQGYQPQPGMQVPPMPAPQPAYQQNQQQQTPQ